MNKFLEVLANIAKAGAFVLVSMMFVVSGWVIFSPESYMAYTDGYSIFIKIIFSFSISLFLIHGTIEEYKGKKKRGGSIKLKQ